MTRFEIDLLNLSTRAKTVLFHADLNFVDEVQDLTLSEFARLKGSGAKTSKEIFKKVRNFQVDKLDEVQVIKNEAFVRGYKADVWGRWQ